MYDEVTHECTCERCGHSWRSRGDKPPTVCSSCTRRNWNSKAREFEVIIARSCGSGENGSLKLCKLDYIDSPKVETDDVFYISKEDLDKYLKNQRYPIGSALVIIGKTELEAETLEIKNLNLVFVIEPGFNFYQSGVTMAFNIKSFYERQKLIKKEKELQEQKAREAEQKQLELLAREKSKLSEEQKLLDQKRIWLAELEQGKA